MKKLIFILAFILLLNITYAIDIWDESDYCTEGQSLIVKNGWWTCDNNYLTKSDLVILTGSTSNFNLSNIYGISLSGTDGTANRTYSINNLILVTVDNSVLHPDIDYTYNTTLINFNNPIWNEQLITFSAKLPTDVINVSYININGTNCSGADGTPSRTFNQQKVLFISIDNSMLQPIKDYAYDGTTITFNNNLWNEQTITIWGNT